MREHVLGTLNVSRETLEKLELFQNLVRKWSPRINLVSQSDLEHLWVRHIADSAQLVDLTARPERWLDLGSGGGFPGLVVAVILQQRGDGRVTLVESDARKCAFLMTAARALLVDVDIVQERIENLPAKSATTVSARALAPLEKLVEHAQAHLAPDGTALFPKGRNWNNELRSAKDKWSFECDVVESATSRDAAILKLRRIERHER